MYDSFFRLIINIINTLYLQEVSLVDFYHLPIGTVYFDKLGTNIMELKPNVARYDFLLQYIRQRPLTDVFLSYP